MRAAETPNMAENRRGLLTDREREILLTDGKDVTEKYYGVVVTRVRNKIKLVGDDLEALEHHDTLAEELRDEVCQPDHAE
jgi:hypothetical protein